MRHEESSLSWASSMQSPSHVLSMCAVCDWSRIQGFQDPTTCYLILCTYLALDISLNMTLILLLIYNALLNFCDSPHFTVEELRLRAINQLTLLMYIRGQTKVCLLLS